MISSRAWLSVPVMTQRVSANGRAAAARRRRRRVALAEVQPGRAQPFQALAVGRVLRKTRARSGPRPRRCRATRRISSSGAASSASIVLELRRQRPRARRADVQNAQAEKQLPERLVLARLDARRSGWRRSFRPCAPARPARPLPSRRCPGSRPTNPCVTNCSTIASPNPSMSIAPRDAKCCNRRRTCAGQAMFWQRIATPSGSCSTGAPHDGTFARESGKPFPDPCAGRSARARPPG